MKLNVKKLLPIAVLAGAVIVMNAGMYVFLKSTQPKVGKRVDVETAQAQKDTLHPASVADSAISSESADHLTAPGDRPDSSAVHTPTGTDVSAARSSTDSVPTMVEGLESDQGKAADPGVVETALTDSLVDSGIVANKSDASNPTPETIKLAKLLETMKPEEAAGILTQLTTEQIVLLVMRMKDRTAGKVLAMLPAEQAAKVALLMSQVADRSHDRQ